MELLSREQREGEPLVCAYDCREVPGGLRAGLLFVREQTSGPVTLATPDGSAAYTVKLPESTQNKNEDVPAVDEFLEITQ